MSSYNLRKRKKSSSATTYCPQISLENGLPETFSPKVCLQRLRLLESHDVKRSRFYLQKGKIQVKQDKLLFSNKKYLLKCFCVVVLLVISFAYWKDYLKSSGIGFIKKCAEMQPSIYNYYYDAIKLHKSILNQFKYSQQKTSKEDKEPVQVLKDNATLTDYNTEIRQLVRDYFIEMKKKQKFQNTVKSPESFIEEQCKRDANDVKDNNYLKKKKFYNATFHDMVNLTDYALESQGAKIVTVFDTELYATITVKYLNLNLGPDVSHFLMKYLKCFSVNGPNSILMPWKKPGDCWAFKGGRGRVQIQLSDEIVITAITLEHIPKEVTTEGNIQSAPKKFSVSGVRDPNSKKTLLGSYEYEISGPAAQTFFIQPKVEIPFRIIEVAVESNHGNEKYTCIYKVRVHGQK